MNRDRSTIIRDMLDVVIYHNKPVNQTCIMYRANLSFTQLRRYLPVLEQQNYITKIGDVFHITDSGIQLFNVLDKSSRVVGEMF